MKRSALLLLPLLTGCGGSKLVMTGPSGPAPAPIRLLAASPGQAGFVDDLITAMGQRGYGVLSRERANSLLRRIDRDGYPAEEPESLAALKRSRVDALLLATAQMVGMGFSQGRIDKAQVRVLGTKAGETLAELEWTNAWGGATGSPADSSMKKSNRAAAEEIADALARQLGPPGPKAEPLLEPVRAQPASEAAPVPSGSGKTEASAEGETKPAAAPPAADSGEPPKPAPAQRSAEQKKLLDEALQGL